MTPLRPSSLRQLAAAAAGQNAHPTNPASAPGDRLYMAGCYKNMYVEWQAALSQASQSPLNLTLLMKEVTAEVCSTPLAKGELLLGKDGALLEVTGDGNRINLDTREVCVATEGEFPISRVHELYRRTVEKLQRHFDAHFAPTENRRITVGHLAMLQQRVLKQYENEALEMIWKEALAARFNQQNNPDLQTHEQIRTFMNDPNHAPQLGQITDLNLYHLNLKAFPPEIGSLTSLRSLSLNENPLRSLPPQIGNLERLRKLSIEGNQLRSLPAEIGALGDLRELRLAWNKLNSLPPEIGGLSSLQSLDVSDNQLRSLPSQIGTLRTLQCLDLQINQLRSLPPEIGALNKLVWINLSNNQLTSVPPEIGALDNLVWLKLDQNQLRSLPREIGAMKKLIELDLRKNQLHFLPPEIGAMDSLQTLDRRDNLWMFISDQAFAKKPSRAIFFKLNKEFMEYPTQSSLGHLFQLIARGEDAATLQNTFEELDSELQNKIRELANVEVSIPVAASSNWAPSTDESLFADIPRLSHAVKKATMEKFENLSLEQKTRVHNEIKRLSGKAEDTQSGRHHACETLLRFINKAIKKFIDNRDYTFDNLLRFVDALEAVTKEL